MSANLAPLNAALSGRYTIERELGAGGMATVYLAHDVRHDRKVALKVLRPELSAILGAARFLTEIKTTANLQHPHILSLFDSGEADGTVFYVMPYIEGESLRDRIKRDHQLPVDEAVRIAREVADALEYAHRQGIVHRDIKPENILLHGGHAMVADFGIALAASKVEGGTRMTETGMSLGTPHYMSPEQAMGEREITPKADIYALGCVLYEMLTAEPPFVGATAQAIFARVLTDEPRSLTLQRKTIPSHIEAAVKTALQKLPADRFESARAFAEALSDPKYATGLNASATRPAASRGKFRVAGWVGVAAAAATLVGGFVVGRGTAPKPRMAPVHFSILLPDSITSVSQCCGRALAVSPDGSTIVYVGIKGSRGALFRRAMGQLESVEIPGTIEGTIPFFSPDGVWLAFEADGKLRKVAMSGGPATPIASASNVNGASWADGDVIVFSQGNRIWTVPAAGGTPRVVPTTDSATRYWHPFALPGGRSALVLASNPSGSGFGGSDQARVAVMDLATGRVDTLGYGMRAEYADGYLLFGAPDNTLLAQPFDAKRGKTRGQATVLLSGVRIPGGLNHEFALTESGWLAYEPGGGGSVESLRAFAFGVTTGATVIALPGRQGDNLEDPAISPDSRFIAMRLVPTGAGARPDLWILDRPQGTLTRFTVGGGMTPVWSRDGKRLAYAMPPGDTSIVPGIYARRADQSGAAQLVLPGRNVFPASWLPGDRGIVFYAQARTKNKGDIGVVTLGDTTPRWVVNSDFEEYNPQLSPDGTRLAFASDRTGKDELYVQPIAAGFAPTQISTEGGRAPRWSSDGRTLYYAQGNSIVAAGLQAGAGIGVSSRRVVMGSQAIDFNFTNVNWDLFPGGKSILYVDQAGTGAPRIAMIQNWVAMVRAMGAPK